MNPIFWVMFAGACVAAIGVGLAAWELDSMRKSRESQLLVYLSEIWESAEYTKARRAVVDHENILAQRMKEYEKKNSEEHFLLVKVSNYFEDVGILVDKRYLSRKIIMELMGTSVKYYYKLYKDYIIQLRNEGKEPDFYKYFERLANS